jgi:predicted DNA-binding antitoxin AbrB/MazE fold protein
MPITIEAIFENGVLKPTQTLPFKEHDKVRLTIEPVLSWVQETSGILAWTGDPEELRRLAEDPEFSILEAYDDEDLYGGVERSLAPGCPFPPYGSTAVSNNVGFLGGAVLRLVQKR